MWDDLIAAMYWTAALDGRGSAEVGGRGSISWPLCEECSAKVNPNEKAAHHNTMNTYEFMIAPETVFRVLSRPSPTCNGDYM